MAIYLDYAATTPVRPEVVETITSSLSQLYGNPSSTYQLGKSAKYALNQAREAIAKDLGLASAACLYFTSGATEANNWAIWSQAQSALAAGKARHLVALAVEHPSVDLALKRLEEEGWVISWIQPQDGGSDQDLIDQFLAASQEATSGWVAMAVNNEVGAIYPIPGLAQEARQRGYFFHVDLVQGITKLPWQLDQIATSWSLSGHKLGGPKGIGLLYFQAWQDQAGLQPYLVGGGQEAGMRAGTENLAYIQGLAQAIHLSLAEAEQRQAHLANLETYFLEELTRAGIDYQVNRPQAHHLPGFLNLWLKGLKASQVLIQLDLAQIYVSAGSACSAGSLEPSRVLKGYYPDQEDRQRESIRLTMGLGLTQADLDQVVKQLGLLKARQQK